MARRTAIASGAGLLAGIVMTVIVTRQTGDGPADDVLARLLLHYAPTIGCTVVGVIVLRRWMAGHAALIRREIEAGADQRRASGQALDRRAAELARREDRMGETLQALIDERAAHDRLKAEHEELVADYNKVVADSLQQSATLFHPGPQTAPGADGVCIPMPARPGLSGPVSEVVKHRRPYP
ncbi:hypothetical protein [Streptomyces sp. NPDC057250]|uniref:hypothetical protein n=1 Tax=Streptomyces sp. NPDC057250 TaxID=3346068 RepID=UPI00362CEC68